MTLTNRKERCRVGSFSVVPKRQHVFAMIDEMAKRERKSKSAIIIRSVEYYYNKKWPGNPQPPLFPKARPAQNMTGLREARLRKAITFLRFKVNFSYDQIAKIVGMSHGFVYKLCKSLNHLPDFNGRSAPMKKRRARAFKRNLRKYQERFQAWLDGKHEKIEEAFRF